MSALFEHLFKVDSTEQPIAPAPHDGSRWSHAVLMDKHARSESLESAYVQDNGDFTKLFGSRRASSLFAKSAQLRERLRAAMGDSTGERDDLLAAFLSNNESAARLAIRRALKQDFPTPERFAVPKPDPGPREITFDEFLEGK